MTNLRISALYCSFVVLAGSACTTGGDLIPEDAGVLPPADGDLADSGAPPPVDAGPGRTPSPGCVSGAEHIFLLSYDRELLRYEPERDHAVTSIGVVRCPETPSGHPFDTNAHTMTVDRSGRAWLFDQGGALYHVNTEDASCTATTFEMAQDEFEFLGAAFRLDLTSDSLATPDEVLFVSGGPTNHADEVRNWSDQLAVIDTDTLAFTTLPRTGAGQPVIVSTDGAGNLWAVSEGELVAADPSTGTLASSGHEVPAMVGFQSSYVFWGGKFYFFLPGDEGATVVYTLEAGSGAWEEVLTLDTLEIVGSGVSTCAPVDLI